MSRFGRGGVRQSSEIEIHGKLLKKNRNGIFQHRYLETQGPSLKYWTSEQEKHTTKAAVFDVREFRSVEVLNDFIVCIQLSHEKFKLELKAVSLEQCNEWADFLRAKMNLYSVDNLKAGIESSSIEFKTRTFASLLRIPVTEQDQWINEVLNETFSAVMDSNAQDEDCSHKTLLACQQCVEELSLTCEECAMEMSLRDPVIISNCRDFMHRYSSLLASRITLELSFYIGKSISSESISDTFLMESLKFAHSINSLKAFQFLPRSFFAVLRENLQTYDQLSKSITQLLLNRNEKWFEELNELQPRQRGHKLREFYKIVNFQVEKIHSSFYISNEGDVEVKRKFIESTINTMVFSLAKYVKLLDFSKYGEEALLEHILACQEIVKYCYGLKIYPYSGKVNERSTSESFGADLGKLSKQWVVALRDDELETLSTIFLDSADNAAASAVRNIFQTFEDIRRMFFQVRPGNGWIGGKACQMYLDRITSWMDGFCQRASSKPCEFHRIAIRETVRMVVFSYIKGLCDRYKNDKKFSLSQEGVMQMCSDIQLISSWINTQTVKLIPPTVKNQSEYKGSNDLTMLLRNIRMFITSDENSLLFCLSEAIMHFGTSSSLHLYDLARLCLKIRDDFRAQSRKYVLGLFSNFLEQLQRASLEQFGPLAKSHPRLSGPIILSELFPNVGSYHCSGKKWSLERLPESDDNARLDIANLVTDACNISRLRRASVTKEVKAVSRKKSSFQCRRQSCGVDDASARLSTSDVTSSEVWQLLDPAYVDNDNASELSHSADESQSEEENSDEEVINDGYIFDEQSCSDKDDYELADDRPFVSLHGCTFEEIHETLRPKMYTSTTFDPVDIRPPLRRTMGSMTSLSLSRSSSPISATNVGESVEGGTVLDENASTNTTENDTKLEDSTVSTESSAPPLKPPKPKRFSKTLSET